MKRKRKKIMNDKICINKLKLIFDRDDSDSLEELIDLGFYDVNKGDSSLTKKEIKDQGFFYKFPLQKAVLDLRLNIVNLLLAKGADIHHKHNEDDNLLIDLILTKGHCCDGELHEEDGKNILRMISLLLENGAKYD